MRLGFIVQNVDTGCENGGPFFGESLHAKHLAETFCSMPLLRRTSEALCCYHSILVISHNYHEVNFPLLAAKFFRVRRSCMLPLRGLRFQLWFKISYPCYIYSNNSVQKLLTFCLVALQQFFCDPLASCFLLFSQLCGTHFEATFLLCNV